MYKGNHLNGEIEIIKENIVFSNSFATLYNDDVKFPQGNKGKYLRFLWNSPYGVIIFPVDANGRILLIKNFRHENRAWSWEVPKGFGETELTPLNCAKKELMEEAGFEGSDWKLLKVIEASNSKTYIYNVVVNTDKSRQTLNQERL